MSVNFLRQGKRLRSVLWHVSRLLTPHKEILVGLGRLELPTSPLSGVRSNQLSYRPVNCVILSAAKAVDQDLTCEP